MTPGPIPHLPLRTTARSVTRRLMLPAIEPGMVQDPVAGLVHASWSFKDDSTTELTHGIHPYPARMVPRIARKVLESVPSRGGTVWDPFCGSGTVLLEAMTHGFPSQGTDLNPFACLLARAKTQTTKAVELRRWTDLLVSRLRGQTADAARKSYRPNLEDFTLDVDRWWGHAVIRDLGYLRQQLDEIASLRASHVAIDLLDVAFARTVRKVSFQRQNQFKRYRVSDADAKGHRPEVTTAFLKNWAFVTRASSELSSSYPKAPAPRSIALSVLTSSPKSQLT